MSRTLFRLSVVVLITILAMVVFPVAGQEYIVRSGYDSPPPAMAAPQTPELVSFWALPLWVMIAQLVLVPVEVFAMLKLWLCLGFRRVFGANVLEQDIRSKIYDHIRENPGIHLHGLSCETGIAMGTLRYHLNILRLTHKITMAEDAATVRFYENSGTYNETEQQLLKHLRNQTTRKILYALMERPEITRQELAFEVGITGPSITWHMKRLENDRIVTTKKTGRSVIYEIPQPVAGYLSLQRSQAPVACR
jgi:predicted transcriptional regulator